jgi:hypothetical protein
MASRERIVNLVIEAVVESLKTGRSVTVPEAARRLWRLFAALNQTRTFHSAGPNPIAYAEMAAYATISGVGLRPRDIAEIRAVDDAYIVAAHKRFAADEEASPISPPSTR